MTLNYSNGMSASEFVDYNVARARDLAFDAVHSLWRRRQEEGLTQTALALFLGRDEGWVSRNLNAPGNWTLRTMATFVAGLKGELDINVFAIEDPPRGHSNFDAYAEYLTLSAATTPTAIVKMSDLVVARSNENDTGEVTVHLRERRP